MHAVRHNEFGGLKLICLEHDVVLMVIGLRNMISNMHVCLIVAYMSAL